MAERSIPTILGRAVWSTDMSLNEDFPLRISKNWETVYSTASWTIYWASSHLFKTYLKHQTQKGLVLFSPLQLHQKQKQSKEQNKAKQSKKPPIHVWQQCWQGQQTPTEQRAAQEGQQDRQWGFAHLGSSQCIAHWTNGFCIFICFLFYLQQLCSLDEGFQGFLSPTIHQIFIPQPFFQLTHIVPVQEHQEH